MDKKLEVICITTVLVKKKIYKTIEEKARKNEVEIILSQSAVTGNTQLLEFSFKNSDSREEWEKKLLTLNPKPLIFSSSAIKVFNNNTSVLSSAKDALYKNNGWEFKENKKNSDIFLQVCFSKPENRLVWEFLMNDLASKN